MMYYEGILFAKKQLDKELADIGYMPDITEEDLSREERIEAVYKHREINKAYQRFNNRLKKYQFSEMEVTITKVKRTNKL